MYRQFDYNLKNPISFVVARERHVAAEATKYGFVYNRKMNIQTPILFVWYCQHFQVLNFQKM